MAKLKTPNARHAIAEQGGVRLLRRGSEAIAVTQQLASFCNAIIIDW